MKEQDDAFIDKTTPHLVPLVGESVLYDIIVKEGVFREHVEKHVRKIIK